jgi:hypothetical protein
LHRILISVVLLAAGLAACTYPVETPPAEAAPVITAYTDRVPGKWVLIVDAAKATTTLQDAGTRCSQSDYPLDLAKTFTETADATFKTVGDDVRVSDHALSKAELMSGGYSGVIVVSVAGLKASIKTNGVVEARAVAETEIEGEAAAAASDAAVQDVVGKLAEQFANSHAIRYSVPGLSPQ